jgi:hypothetical protein
MVYEPTGSDRFTPGIFLGKMFTEFEGCFFADILGTFEFQEILPLGRSFLVSIVDLVKSIPLTLNLVGRELGVFADEG